MAVAGYRALATMVLQFGVTAIPVKVIKGTESPDRATLVKQVHAGDCGGEVGRKNYCKACEEELEAADIGKAVSGVQFDEALLDEFKVPSDKAIVVDSFVPFNAIDPRLMDEPRYLVPDKGGHGPLRAFADTMLDRLLKGVPVAAIGKMAERDREKVVAIYVVAVGRQGEEKPALVAGLLRRPEDVRDATAIAAEVATATAPTPQVKNMVGALIDAMFEPILDVTKYTDEKAKAREELLKAIAAETERPAPKAVTEPRTTGELDLMAALTASIGSMPKKAAKKAKANRCGVR